MFLVALIFGGIIFMLGCYFAIYHLSYRAALSMWIVGGLIAVASPFLESVQLGTLLAMAAGR